MEKYATCPKSPSHTTFKERVQVTGEAWLILAQDLQPFEMTVPHRTEVAKRSITKLCAICGSAAVTWLPKAFRSP